jgi:hypothetical protein
MMEKSALADEGGGGTSSPLSLIVTIMHKVAVYAPTEKSDHRVHTEWQLPISRRTFHNDGKITPPW